MQDGEHTDRGDSGLGRFAETLFADARPDELRAYDSDGLFRIAQSFWRYAARRTARQSLLRVFNPTLEDDGWQSPHTVLQLVCDDKPFLLTSVLGELTSQNLELHAAHDPVVHVERDEDGRRTAFARAQDDSSRGAIRESMIHIEFEYHSDAKLLKKIENDVRRVVEHVELAVSDFGALVDRLDETIEGLRNNPSKIDRNELDENIAFLMWLRDNHFIFLGSRIYRFEGEPETGDLVAQADSGLGLLRDPDTHTLRRGGKPTSLTPEVREFLMHPSPLIITKANIRSDIHRRAYMDYIGVKLFDGGGALTGEYRFIGLFTADAYNQSVFRIPLLARKAERVIESSGFSRVAFKTSVLRNILETFPRDELFQVAEEELLRLSQGLLDLQARPRTRLFLRYDRYDRYISALVYIPRDRYDSAVRERVAEILVSTFNGRLSAYYPRFDDMPLARVHYIIGLSPERHIHRPDVNELERRIIETARSWYDDLVRVFVLHHGEEQSRPLVARYGDAFSAGYRDGNSSEDAFEDAKKLEPLGAFPTIAFRCFRRKGDPADGIRLKLYRERDPIPLSDVLPILENMGLFVIQEVGHPVERGDARFWIHEFYMTHCERVVLDKPQTAENLGETFAAVWHEQAENDRFNHLGIDPGLNWRDISLIRAIAFYRRQTGNSFSIDYMQDTFINHTSVAAKLIELFKVRFDPDLPQTLDQRNERHRELRTNILKALEEVKSLDEDLIIRRFLNFIESLWRTNFFQKNEAGRAKPYISFKISSRDVEGLPAPTPLTEIFVYSPRVEGIHLRWGSVARGGLRWSDRREDFRTEILGLGKAQQVKNAVIVPVGAKGGFVPKRLPPSGDREEVRKEGVACYRTFISGLLDLSDNIVAGEVVKPGGVIAHDGDDSYLVVAADKGTATFSDIANSISEERGFWLGDAFASGGSRGYDHKKMGITARGAWEAVKRHFRELGKDIRSEAFTVIGVGDMSGDVFGNGMLLSEQIKLVATFDHRDIFIDPNPDPAQSHAERRRLFDLPRSSWSDYNVKLISKGGGIFSRSLKTIKLTPEIRAALDTDKDKLTPRELIREILKAPAELLWLGGIGTYIKGESEHHAEVGDKANDAVRIDAPDLRVKIIGEGANLGVTQAGRISFARSGGKINMDAVDNAGGVDCSDHEVNIKILLGAVVAGNRLDRDERNRLLDDMRDEVAAHVLRNNYDQTLTLSLASLESHQNIHTYKRLMERLESEGRLDRHVEGLPDNQDLNNLVMEGKGLTRPELAVLMAYAKIVLFDEIVDSDVPDDTALLQDLKGYFPPVLDQRFGEYIKNHQLRREIIATVLASRVINVGGIHFTDHMFENTAATADLAVRGFIVVDSVFQLNVLRERVDSLDNVVPAQTQLALYSEIATMLRRKVQWFLRYGCVSDGGRISLPLVQTIDAYKPGVEKLRAHLDDVLSTRESERIAQRTANYSSAGVDEVLARDVVTLETLASACDIVDIARDGDRSLIAVAQAYFSLGKELGLDHLRSRARSLRISEHWEKVAVSRLVDDLLFQQRSLTLSVVSSLTASAEDTVRQWLEDNQSAIERTMSGLADMETDSGLTMAKLSLAASQIRDLAMSVNNR